LSNVNWEENMGDLNVFDAWDYFSESFNKFLQQTVPMTTAGKHRNKNIYITREAKSPRNKEIICGGNTPELALNLILLPILPLVMLCVA